VTVYLGTLVKPVGLRGEVKLRQSEDFWQEALESAHLLLVQGEARRAVRVRMTRVHSAGMQVLGLEGVENREGAEALVGADLFLEADELDVPEPPAVMPFQVRGVQVFLPDGRLLGTIEDVLPMPAQDVFIVRDGEREYKIPDVPAIVRRLDLERRVMQIDPIPGLLEI
jgi:16S rRNA processing protein RimM